MADHGRGGTATVEAPARPVRSQTEAYALADWGLLATIALIWGSSFVLIDIAIESLTPTLVTLLRLVTGAVTLAVVPAARRPMPAREWPALVLLGSLWMAVPFVLFPLAQQRIDSSLAGMLNGAVPLTAAAVATILARRLPSRRTLAGLALGFAGVVAISWPALQGARATLLGAAMVVLAVCCYGVAINLAVPLQRRYGTLPVLLRAELAAVVLVAPVGLAGVGGSSFAWQGMAAVLALGSLGTALAFVCMGMLVSRVGATRAAITIYFTPIVAIVGGVVFRGERVAVASLFGTALVLAGAWLATRKEH